MARGHRSWFKGGKRRYDMSAQNLFAGERAVIMECLQPLLAQRWLRGERAKGQISDWRRMRFVGRAEAKRLPVRPEHFSLFTVAIRAN